MKSLTLTPDNTHNLKLFADLLKKDENSIINEALELYFKEETQRLNDEKNSQTNLSYDEFWDDVDI